MTEGLFPAVDDPTEGNGPKRERSDSQRFVKPVFPREPHEHYVEEPWVSRRLFETRDFGGVIVDPCAGFGNVVVSARACGLRGYGTDLVKRAHFVAGGRDFLGRDWRAPRRAGPSFAIVGNPPFGGRKPLIRLFAQAALERAESVALLVPLKRLSAAGEWLAGLPLVETLLLRPRSSLWPGAIYAEKLAAGEPLRNGFDDVVWLVFRRGARATRRVNWLGRDA